MNQNDASWIRAFLKVKREIMGGYARSVNVHRSHYLHICPICAGPKSEYFQYCSACAALEKSRWMLAPEGVHLSDRVCFGCYAYEGEQMYRVMSGYKDRELPQRSTFQKCIQFLAFDALYVHAECMRKTTGSLPTCWTVIPSTQSSKNYGHPSVLEHIVAPIMRELTIPMVRLAAQDEKKRRNLDPDRFTIAEDPTVLDLSHVLLVDDSWVTGATVQSAAAMFRLLGARQITTYCAARVVDLNWVNNNLGESVADGFRKLKYHNYCPWGAGYACPATRTAQT